MKIRSPLWYLLPLAVTRMERPVRWNVQIYRISHFFARSWVAVYRFMYHPFSQQLSGIVFAIAWAEQLSGAGFCCWEQQKCTCVQWWDCWINRSSSSYLCAIENSRVYHATYVAGNIVCSLERIHNFPWLCSGTPLCWPPLLTPL